MILTLSKPPLLLIDGTKQVLKRSTEQCEKKIEPFLINAFVIPKPEKNFKTKPSQNGTEIINICLNNQEISKAFSDNYKALLEYTEKAIRSLNRNVDSSTMLSESYLHLHKFRNEIFSESEVVSYCKNFIKMNLRWTNSPVLRNERTIFIEARRLDQDNYNADPRAEEWIEEWENTLQILDRRLWTLWYHKNLRKGREFSEHLNISISGSYTYIRRCKELEQELRAWILEKIV